MDINKCVINIIHSFILDASAHSPPKNKLLSQGPLSLHQFHSSFHAIFTKES